MPVPARMGFYHTRFVRRFLFKRLTFRQTTNFGVALTSLLGAVVLLSHHPYGWWLALPFGVTLFTVARWPKMWWFMVPVSLVFLNFSPWTGWIIFDEFDLLLLAVVAAVYGKLALRKSNEINLCRPIFPALLMFLLAATGLLSLVRAWINAGHFEFDWFATYSHPLNTVRVFKSLGFSLLLARFLPASPSDVSRLVRGMVAGMTVVAVAVLWERLNYTGLFNFSTHYRTVALFWEMHVGGAAIDAYLAIGTPFVVWAVWETRRPSRWGAAAMLAVFTVYTDLTTFSRGVYLSVFSALIILCILKRFQKLSVSNDVRPDASVTCENIASWQVRAGMVLIITLGVEVALVWGSSSFMQERAARVGQDFGSRVAHWKNGLALLTTPVEWCFGLGLGRLPANYASRLPHEGFPGQFMVYRDIFEEKKINSFVHFESSSVPVHLAKPYVLTERVSTFLDGRYTVQLNVRAHKSTEIFISLCERHLLYDMKCQWAAQSINPTGNLWQTLTLPLFGPDWSAQNVFQRGGVFSIGLLRGAAPLDVDEVKLVDVENNQWLKNGNFSQGLSYWFPVSPDYFLPWHIDNLFLELLIERGILGLLTHTALIAYAFWNLILGRARTMLIAPYLASSVCAVLCIGCISSVMDVPRVAFIFYLLTLLSIHIKNDSNRCLDVLMRDHILEKNQERSFARVQTESRVRNSGVRR